MGNVTYPLLFPFQCYFGWLYSSPNLDLIELSVAKHIHNCDMHCDTLETVYHDVPPCVITKV